MPRDRTICIRLDRSGKAWEENSALAIEAEKRYKTTASRLQILGNEMNAIAMDAGQEFVLPGLEAAMGQAKQWIEVYAPT